MRLFLDCYACILRQALATSRLSGLQEMESKRALDEAMRLLLACTEETSPQSITTGVYEFIHRNFFNHGGVFDPYAPLKKECTDLILEQFDYLEKLVLEADSPLEMAIKNAAAGNVIDFGALDYRTIDIAKEIQNIPSLQFSIHDFEKLSEQLHNARSILYIGDNAGEIVFDRILIRQIKRQFPNVNIVLAARDRPIINDITPADAYLAGINEDAKVISSGSIYPGTILSETTPEFQALFRDADVIIAKGQGNYEGLWEIDDERLFFILRVKCDRIAESLGTRTGALVLKQKATSPA